MPQATSVSIFSREQHLELEKHFKMDGYPDYNTLMTLATRLNLKEYDVQVRTSSLPLPSPEQQKGVGPAEPTGPLDFLGSSLQSCADQTEHNQLTL
jgi:hypothetical protein